MSCKVFVAVGLGALTFAAPAQAVESPPSGISPSEFATQYSGCLGQLRSLIAQGDFAGVGPFGQHFTGLVNPGAHQGTVGEEEFLEVVIGIRPTSWTPSARGSRAATSALRPVLPRQAAIWRHFGPDV